MKLQNKSLSRMKEIVIRLIVLVIISAPFLSKMESIPFHGDENLSINNTKYFKLFFVDRDLHNEQWKTYWVLDHPPVGTYILGLALVVAGYKDRIDELGKMPRWQFTKDYNWNVAHGALPSKEILYAGRFTMAIMGVLSCLLIFWIGRTVFSTSAGILAALLLAYNPLMLWCSKHVMTDAPLIFFMTGNVALMLLFYSFLIRRKVIPTLILAGAIGINIALAAGTKLNGGLAGIIFAMFCIFFILVKMTGPGASLGQPLKSIKKFVLEKEIKIILIGLFLSGCIAILVFVGLNPYLYGQPLRGSLKMIEYRSEMAKLQRIEIGPSVTSSRQKIIVVIRKTLIDKEYNTLNNFTKIPLGLGFFLLGLLLLLYEEGKHLLLHHKPSLRSVLLIWVFVTFIGVMLWIPLDWDRYYLPIIPCVALIAGLGLERFLFHCFRFAKSAVNRA